MRISDWSSDVCSSDLLSLGKLVAYGPILKAAQFCQCALHTKHGILIDPTDAGSIGAQRRRDPGRQAPGCKIEVFEHAAAGPVEIRAFLEDDIDERDAEIRETTYDLRAWNVEQCGCHRIGDLVFHDLWCLAGIIGVDDAQIGIAAGREQG